MPEPKDAKSPTHQVSIVFLSTLEKHHRDKPNQAKSTIHQTSKAKIVLWREHGLEMAQTTCKRQRPTMISHGRTQVYQMLHPINNNNIVANYYNTFANYYNNNIVAQKLESSICGRKPQPNPVKSTTHQVSAVVLCFVKEHDLQTKTQRCQELYPPGFRKDFFSLQNNTTANRSNLHLVEQGTPFSKAPSTKTPSTSSVHCICAFFHKGRGLQTKTQICQDPYLPSFQCLVNCSTTPPLRKHTCPL
jgi:hypothetical protein